MQEKSQGDRYRDSLCKVSYGTCPLGLFGGFFAVAHMKQCPVELFEWIF